MDLTSSLVSQNVNNVNQVATDVIACGDLAKFRCFLCRKDGRIRRKDFGEEAHDQDHGDYSHQNEEPDLQRIIQDIQ